MSIKKVQKSSDICVCEICDYSTSRKSQYTRHLTTDKHKNNVLSINVNDSAIIKVPNDYICTNHNGIAWVNSIKIVHS